ncbi:MAG: OmpA family protein [Bacteroidia bacterium]
MKIQLGGKIALAVLIGGAAFFGIKKYQNRAVKVEELQSSVKVTLPDAPEPSLTGTAAVKLPLPGTKQTQKDALLPIKWDMMAWQSQNSALLANGGANTTEGSLFENAGLNVSIVRQDNCVISKTAMIQYCKDYKAGKTKEGYFVTYMASGTASFLTDMFNATKELGSEYQPVAWLTFGKSAGEDQVIGSPEIKANKKLLVGKVLRGVKLDGDIDMALKLCADNDIKINPNPKLYYADALNLSYVSGDNGSYLTAVQDYNANLKETRKVVVNGVTGADTTVQIDLVATWTPGDVNASEGRGGATIISTKDYKWIMPNITITSKKFLNDNRDKMKQLVLALATAGDQIRSFEDIKKLACGIGAKVWNEKDEAYWYKYYNGEKKNDFQLGGSQVFNLKDMAFVFGLDGTRDNYKDVYNQFGKLQTLYYKSEFPEYIAYEKAVDKSIMRDVYDEHKDDASNGAVTKTDYSTTATEVIGDKSISIQFATGSAQITSPELLASLAEQIGSSVGAQVFIEGHTDNTGNPDANRLLSKQRADAVVAYLVSKGLDDKMFHASGFGPDKPIASNSTVAGKAKNRRVQIILKN